jgi:hypothetical protein
MMIPMKNLLILILLLPTVSLASSSDASLRYEAFLAGAAIGEATVNVAFIDGAYVVEGSARSSGLWQRFSKWRTQFAARGDLTEAASGQFSYFERHSDSSRIVDVRDGVLQVTKNGRQRPPVPSPAGPDLLSALFVPPHCGAAEVVHTGRHVYRLTRLASDERGCRYRVVDEDDDVFELELLLDRLGHLIVPKRITVYGRLTASMILVGSEVGAERHALR